MFGPLSARLEAANRDTAVAVSARFPRLSLSADYSTSDNTVEELFDSWVWSLAGSLVAPLFEGGSRAADVDRSQAREDQRLYEYGQTILNAFQEVEQALILERQQIQQIDQLIKQIDAAEQASKQLRVEYLNGVSNFLDILTARTEEQQLRREKFSAYLRLLEIRIGLYRALAGSIETEMDETS